jgi:hypothetical protein
MRLSYLGDLVPLSSPADFDQAMRSIRRKTIMKIVIHEESVLFNRPLGRTVLSPIQYSRTMASPLSSPLLPPYAVSQVIHEYDAERDLLLPGTCDEETGFSAPMIYNTCLSLPSSQQTSRVRLGPSDDECERQYLLPKTRFACESQDDDGDIIFSSFNSSNRMYDDKEERGRMDHSDIGALSLADSSSILFSLTSNTADCNTDYGSDCSDLFEDAMCAYSYADARNQHCQTSTSVSFGCQTTVPATCSTGTEVCVRVRSVATDTMDLISFNPVQVQTTSTQCQSIMTLHGDDIPTYVLSRLESLTTENLCLRDIETPDCVVESMLVGLADEALSGGDDDDRTLYSHSGLPSPSCDDDKTLYEEQVSSVSFLPMVPPPMSLTLSLRMPTSQATCWPGDSEMEGDLGSLDSERSFHHHECTLFEDERKHFRRSKAAITKSADWLGDEEFELVDESE